MGVIRYEKEVSVSVAPSRMFKAFILDNHILFPKLLPQAFKSMVLEKGDGGVGSIKVVNFAEGNKHTYAKQRVDALDKENFTCKYTVFEEDNMLDILETMVYDVKFEAAENGGTICKSATEFHLTKDPESKVEEDLKKAAEEGLILYNIVEGYLLANPDLYA
ncbi:major allergen Pru ar 1-like [Melia azedarach]|uniref:Major allergen Pru ar 1-like n=1 Tax=Melia azedarach TaxID=155640 RepID=A0ACC1YG63_MELAZ|nr:major allergen Pru ar 1-like [Melia azedarach]